MHNDPLTQSQNPIEIYSEPHLSRPGAPVDNADLCVSPTVTRPILCQAHCIFAIDAADLRFGFSTVDSMKRHFEDISKWPTNVYIFLVLDVCWRGSRE